MADIEKTRRVYQVLGLRDFAPSDEVKRAFREMALLHHPDKNRDDPEAENRFKTINAAYQLLNNEARKASYDSSLALARAAEARLHTGAGRAEPSSQNNPYAPMSNATASFVRTATQYTDELNAYRESRRSHSQNAGRRPATQPATTAPDPQAELFKKREKEREREVARRLEKEREEKREKELEKVKRLQAQRTQEEERRKREQDKLREKIDRIFGSQQQQQQPTPLSTHAVNLSPAAAAAAAEIRNRAATSAAQARNARSTVAPHPYETAGTAGSPRAAAVPSADSEEVKQTEDTAISVETARDERLKQQEMRHRAHEKQIEARLAQLRVLEEKRASEEAAERSQQFQRRIAELDNEEDQERKHYIAPHEAHERSRIIASLRRVEKAYHDVDQQQRMAGDERDQRSAIQLFYTWWICEASLLRKHGEFKADLVRCEREAFSEALRDFYSVLDRMHSRFLQLKAVAIEYEYHRGRILRAEACSRDMVHVRVAEDEARTRFVVDERVARQNISTMYWQHKATVMFENDEVVVRRRIWRSEEAAFALVALVEGESRHRTAVELAESSNFLATLKKRSDATLTIHRSMELAIEKLMRDLTESRNHEASFRADVLELRSAAQAERRSSDSKMEQLRKKLQDEADAERSKVIAAEAKAAAMTMVANDYEMKLAAATAALATHTASDRRSTRAAADWELQLAESNAQLSVAQEEARKYQAQCRRLSEELAAVRTGAPSAGNAGADDAMIASLRRRIAELEAGSGIKSVADAAASGAGNRELVQMLCAENQRLLEANARLLNENKLLGGGGGGAVPKSAPTPIPQVQAKVADFASPPPPQSKALSIDAAIAEATVPRSPFRAVPAASAQGASYHSTPVTKPASAAPALLAPHAASPLPPQRSSQWRSSAAADAETPTYFQPLTTTVKPSSAPSDAGRGQHQQDGSRQVILARAVARSATATQRPPSSSAY